MQILPAKTCKNPGPFHVFKVFSDLAAFMWTEQHVYMLYAIHNTLTDWLHRQLTDWLAGWMSVCFLAE